MNGWRQVASDPISGAALEARRHALADRWRPFDSRRNDALATLCTGAKVLDIGCVDEGAETIGALHRALAAVAAQCVGVDNDCDGIAALRAEGMDVRYADINEPAPVDLGGPFDVVVAADVIEHLSAPQRLLDFADGLLAPGGTLILTTPNPYSMHRVRAGWDQVVWENVDHVTYLFPSGMVELAGRAGMRLAFYGTCRTQGWDDDEMLPSARRFFAAKRRGVALPAWYVPPYVRWLRRRTRAMLRETMVYGLCRGAPDVD